MYNFEFFFPEYCYIFQPVCTPQWPTCACPTRKGSAPSLEIFDYFDYHNIFRNIWNIWNIWNKKRERAIFGNILSLSNLFRAPFPPLLRSDILGYNYFRHCKDWEKHFFHIDEHLKSKSTCFMLSELFGLRMLHTCDKHFEFPPIPKCLNIFYFCWFQNVWQFWCFCWKLFSSLGTAQGSPEFCLPVAGSSPAELDWQNNNAVFDGCSTVVLLPIVLDWMDLDREQPAHSWHIRTWSETRPAAAWWSSCTPAPSPCWHWWWCWWGRWCWRWQEWGPHTPSWHSGGGWASCGALVLATQELK